VGAATPAGRGRFITIEGPEGAGKTSQAERLVDRLAASGVDVRLVREPGSTPLGEAVRALLLHRGDGLGDRHPRVDALLFNAARAQLVADVIRPALDAGTWVVCTRFADSTVAYQGFGGGLPVDELREIERFATGGLRPDLTILLDVPVEVGLRRKTDDERTRFEDLDLDFHRRVRDGFRSLAEAEPERWAVVDATAEPGTVADAVVAAIDRRIGLPAGERGGEGGGASPPERHGAGGQTSDHEPGAASLRIQR
jgi:dTMP kinase